MKPPITPTASIWGVHAGQSGDASSLFLDKNCIALGWGTMRGLSKIKPKREAYKPAVEHNYGIPALFAM